MNDIFLINKIDNETQSNIEATAELIAITIILKMITTTRKDSKIN